MRRISKKRIVRKKESSDLVEQRRQLSLNTSMPIQITEPTIKKSILLINLTVEPVCEQTEMIPVQRTSLLLTRRNTIPTFTLPPDQEESIMMLELFGISGDEVIASMSLPFLQLYFVRTTISVPDLQWYTMLSMYSNIQPDGTVIANPYNAILYGMFMDPDDMWAPAKIDGQIRIEEQVRALQYEELFKCCATVIEC